MSKSLCTTPLWLYVALMVFFFPLSCCERERIRSVARHHPLHDYKGGSPAKVEGVPAAALGGGPAAGARGAGDRTGSELRREAVSDAEAVEPAAHCEPERCLLGIALHGFIRLFSAVAGKLGEAEVEKLAAHTVCVCVCISHDPTNIQASLPVTFSMNLQRRQRKSPLNQQDFQTYISQPSASSVVYVDRHQSRLRCGAEVKGKCVCKYMTMSRKVLEGVNRGRFHAPPGNAAASNKQHL